MNLRLSEECYACIKWQNGRCSEGIRKLRIHPCLKFAPIPEPEPYEAETMNMFDGGGIMGSRRGSCQTPQLWYNGPVRGGKFRSVRKAVRIDANPFKREGGGG